MSSSIDTIRFNETPEGIALELKVAGPVPRALALVLDAVIRIGLYLVLLPMAALADLGVGLMLLGFFLLEWFYPVVFEVLKGATPGKRVMGLVVVHDDGTPVGLSASMIRNLLRVVDFLPLFYAVGLVSVLLDRDFRRLGDLAAGTLVLHAEGRLVSRPVSDTPPRQAPPGLGLETQQAILSFAERSQRLSSARRAELAEILTAAIDGTADDAVERLAGWASWLARGREPEAS